ncbi:TITAN-like protein [Hibiscus syriacus]|uniref:TITAN-like protein n=1 Tax=Hibiscus syriacus TaxID=106335 RepID=A0A6A2XAU2_HIBSY|nr:TITAN-like protein [Hibiscus syriacus]
MEQLDKYRIAETDLTKWEKKCESLKDGAMPAPIEDLVLIAIANKIFFTTVEYALGMLTSAMLGSAKRIRVQEWAMEKAVPKSFTQDSSISTVGAGGNVLSGAPPPWLEATDQTLLDNQVKPVSSTFMLSNKSWKSHKMNPKRVGAAWAEKRKMELEKEKRWEIVESDCDANWLPNFGRVWQSGSRKESRKEFESEKQKFLTVESQSEMPVKIQPYISKRMYVGSILTQFTFSPFLGRKDSGE